jgi:hypothetical protein
VTGCRASCARCNRLSHRLPQVPARFHAQRHASHRRRPRWSPLGSALLHRSALAHRDHWLTVEAVEASQAYVLPRARDSIRVNLTDSTNLAYELTPSFELRRVLSHSVYRSGFVEALCVRHPAIPAHRVGTHLNAVGVVDQPIEDAIGQSGMVTPDKSLIAGSGYLRNLVPGVVLLSGQQIPMLQVSVSYCFPKLRRRPVESN